MKKHLNFLRSGASEKTISLRETPIEGLVEDFVSAEILRNILSELVTDLFRVAYSKTVIKAAKEHGFRIPELERGLCQYNRSYETKIRKFIKAGGDVDDYRTRIRNVLRNI